MRYMYWKRKTPPEGPKKPLTEAATGPGDQAACYPVRLTRARQQTTPPISTAATRRDQWIQNKVRENHLRDLAIQRSLQLPTPPHRNAGTGGSDAGRLTTATHNASSDDTHLLVQRVRRMTVGKVENHPGDGVTHAEAIDYLSRTHGATFVGDLIKHLHNPGERNFPWEAANAGGCRSAPRAGSIAAVAAATASKVGFASIVRLVWRLLVISIGSWSPVSARRVSRECRSGCKVQPRDASLNTSAARR